MTVMNSDLSHEVLACRPLIVGWMVSLSTLMAGGLIAIACLSLFAAVKSNSQTIRVFSVTEKGDVFELPFYMHMAEAQTAAGVIDDEAAAQPAAAKLMSHVRSGP